MRRLWGLSIFATVVAVMATLLTATPAEAYSPGTATGYRPTYNASTGNWDYHCSYSGWRSGATVIWQCNLHEISVGRGGGIQDVIKRRNSGSWTPGPTSYTTGTFHFPLFVGEGMLCTEAYALSVDGGVTGPYACN